MTVRHIGILGSTGSIGTQTLQVIRELNSRCSDTGVFYEVSMLSAGRNKEILASQAREFSVKTLCIESEDDAKWLKDILPEADVLYGEDGLCEAAASDMDMLITAIVGMRGLKPTLAAIEHGTDIGLANKETLVAAGGIVMKKAQERGINIIPVDSEHSAIFQSLRGAGAGGKAEVSKLILTASGGPFRGKKRDELSGVTKAQTMNHPTWKMGGKITVDCATMMNKGLEVIEAMYLFTVPPEQIDVLVHPQSIVHSMVEFRDGSVIAQLGNPDMKVPIQLAITYPVRELSETKRLRLDEIGTLTFEKPDTDTFGCLAIALEGARTGGTYPVVMNGANEAAVGAFLEGKISFTQIEEAVYFAVNAHMKGTSFIKNPTLEEILFCDKAARKTALEYIADKCL